MEHSDNRAGLLVCNDLNAAISAMIKTNPKTQNIKYEELGDPLALWENDPYIIELLSYSVSDSFFRLRKMLGFAIA